MTSPHSKSSRFDRSEPLKRQFDRAQGRSISLRRKLLGCASDYITEAVHPGWVLVVTIEDGLVYFGPSPASVERSPAPF
ncbi:hypothetical protein FSY59_00560 [Comamonas sp. Z3]|nr:hypothetical protein FSY59_00560 [Comamonas sp. Z3]